MRSIGLRRGLRVQRREDEVAGLGGGERDRDGLEVAELADEDDVGVLPQHVLECRREAVGVVADLALVDERLLVDVQELDRVLDRHDVVGARAVHEVDECGERRRLARTGRARDEHEPARELREAADRLGHAELLELLDLGRDETERAADRAALLVEVHAEARLGGEREGEVELELSSNCSRCWSLMMLYSALVDLVALPRHRVARRPQTAVDADHRRRVRRHVQVGGTRRPPPPAARRAGRGRRPERGGCGRDVARCDTDGGGCRGPLAARSAARASDSNTGGAQQRSRRAGNSDRLRQPAPADSGVGGGPNVAGSDGAEAVGGGGRGIPRAHW